MSKEQNTPETVAVPEWVLLAAQEPSSLTEKGKLLVRLNMAQQGMRPAKNNYAKGQSK